MGGPQTEAPYLDALRAYAERDPGRFHVPGHKGGQGADPGLVDAIGERALAFDIPALVEGIDIGETPTPFERAQTLAAEAWGSAPQLVPRQRRLAGQPRGPAHAGAHGEGDRGAAQRPLEHRSTRSSCPACGPTFVAPELDPELHIAHCMTPEALDSALAETPDAVGATMVSPTYFGAVADVAGLAEVAHSHGVPLIVDEAWGAHLAFHEDLPDTRARARRRPRDLERAQDRRQPHPVGDGPPGPAATGSTSTWSTAA